MDNLFERSLGLFRANLAARRYSLRLHGLYARIRSPRIINAINCSGSKSMASADLDVLGVKYSSLIQEQVDLLQQYAVLPVEHTGKAWDCRIVKIASDYLRNSEATLMDVEGYGQYLRERVGSTRISLAELNVAIHALKLAILLTRCSVLLEEAGVTKHLDLQAVRDCLLVLEALGSYDSESFVRRLISYEQLLEADPSGIFMRVDVSTRNLYRAAVEKLADECECDPDDVARQVLRLSQAAAFDVKNRDDSLRQHIGYYLLDTGKSVLRLQLCKAINLGAKPDGHPDRHYLNLYGALVFICVSLLTTIFIVLSAPFYLPTPISIAYIVLAGTLCYETAEETVRILLSGYIPERILPGLDYKSGIPSTSKTVVAVPCLLVNEYQVKILLSRVEEHYLSVKGGHVSVAILSDYGDSDVREASPYELELLDLAQRLTRSLNEKHGNGVDRFCLLHRERSFSQVQKQWMGSERKRGKLILLDRLILTGRSEFDCVEGDVTGLHGATFVALVDDDNRLSKSAVQMMVGILSHPLNSPRIPSGTRCLNRGYVALHPCMATSQESLKHWLFLKPILPPAVDPVLPGPNIRYLDFDLFGDCGFFGIGLYHVSALQSLKARDIPSEQTISPEIIESGFMRTGWPRSVCFVQPFPRRLALYYERLHRWTRGDWQNFAIIVRGTLTGLSGFSKYIVLSRIRSSLSAIARCVLLAVVACSPTKLSVLRFIAYVALSGLSEFSALLLTWCSLFMNGQLKFRWVAIVRALFAAFTRQLLLGATSAHEAFVMLDAIIRTNVRVFRRKKLLEWRAAGTLEFQRQRFGLIDFYALASVVASVLLLVSASRSGRVGTIGIVIPALWIAYVVFYFERSSQEKQGLKHSETETTL